MSIRIMTWVLDEAPVADSTQTLVLLCLADWADDHGLCWPSIGSIARRARCSESTARRAVRALEDAGLVIRQTASAGRATNLYRIIRTATTNPVTVTGSESYPQDPNPVTMTPRQNDRVAPPTLAPMTANPCVGDTPTLAWVTPEPSLNPQEPPAAAREASLGLTDGTAARAVDTALAPDLVDTLAVADGTAVLEAIARDSAPQVDALAAACRAAGLTASFANLGPIRRATISALVQLHGIGALVAEARRHHRADDPARYATAWMELWKFMPVPQAPAPTAKRCGECGPGGWIEDPETGFPLRRCTCRTHVAGGIR